MAYPEQVSQECAAVAHCDVGRWDGDVPFVCTLLHRVDGLAGNRADEDDGGRARILAVLDNGDGGHRAVDDEHGRASDLVHVTKRTRAFKVFGHVHQGDSEAINGQWGTKLAHPCINCVLACASPYTDVRRTLNASRQIHFWCLCLRRGCTLHCGHTHTHTVPHECQCLGHAWAVRVRVRMCSAQNATRVQAHLPCNSSHSGVARRAYAG